MFLVIICMRNQSQTTQIAFALCLLLMCCALTTPSKSCIGCSESSSTTFLGMNIGNLSQEELMALRANLSKYNQLSLDPLKYNISSNVTSITKFNATAAYTNHLLSENNNTVDIKIEDASSKAENSNQFLWLFFVPIVLFTFIVTWRKKVSLLYICRERSVI